jgi:type IV secretion system protein TrbJ
VKQANQPDSGISLRSIKRWFGRATTALVFMGLLTAARPAHALFGVGDIVFDPASYVQLIAQVENTIKMVEQAKQTYLIFNSVYQGVKNWQSFGWIQILDMADLPFFDGIDGIDDIRDMATLTEMSVLDLAKLFGEVKTMQRLINDPRYRENATRRMTVDLMRIAQTRSRKRRMVFTRAMKKQQIQVDKLNTQARSIQNQIEIESASESVAVATIQGLQARLVGIQIQIQAVKDGMWAMMRSDELKVKQEDEELRSNMREAGYTNLESDIDQSMQLARQFAGSK